MVHQHFSLVPRMTVVENLMLGQVKGMLHRHEFGARIRDIAERFGFTLDPDAVVGELSVGERQRAEIVKCLMRDPKLLVLDEPTAVLPPGEIGAAARHLPPGRRFRPRRHPGHAQAGRDRPVSPTASPCCAPAGWSPTRAWPAPTWARWSTPWSAAS